MSKTPEEIEAAVAALDSLDGGDPEGDHGEADKILLSMVPNEVAAAWRRARERAGGWWYA